MNWVRFLPVFVLFALASLAFYLRLDTYLSIETLKANRDALRELVAQYGPIAAVVYVALYTLATALSLPGAVIITLAGDFLFGATLGTFLTVIGATVGATVLFLVARSAFGSSLRARAGPFLARMADGFSQNAFNYLLFLRLVPAFPFWAVNLAPALLGMKLKDFVAATFLGIIPATAVFSTFGASLAEVFDRGDNIELRSVLSPQLLGALVALGLLALLPVFLRRGKSS